MVRSPVGDLELERNAAVFSLTLYGTLFVYSYIHGTIKGKIDSIRENDLVIVVNVETKYLGLNIRFVLFPYSDVVAL